MYAIVNVKTGEYVYGTDYRYSPPRQRTSKNQMLTYDNLFRAKHDFLNRKCGKKYLIAELNPVEIKQLIHPPEDHCEILVDEIFLTNSD